MSKRLEELDTNFKGTTAKIKDELIWIRAQDRRFTIDGLPWFKENGGEFFRLPKRAKEATRAPVWELGTMPSGGRVRFKTDSTSLKLRVHHSHWISQAHFCAVGVSGIDLYEGPPARMTYWASSRTIEARKPYVSTYFEKLSKRMREFTLYLPIYNDLVSLEVGLDPTAKILAPSPFRLLKPVVVYGTSITQGGCASRGANGWVPLVGRILGVDIVNLGFSGNGKCDMEVADLLTEIDAACYVNDCVGNMSLEDMKARYAAFNDCIRARRSNTPILLMTSIRYAGEGQFPGRAEHWAMMRRFVIKTYQQFRKRGDRNIHFFDCRKLKGFERDHPSVDGSHLTDLGFKLLADGVAPVLKTILKIR